LEQWRRERGLTRQQLAEAVGVHYQTVGYLERDEYSPSLSLALRIAAVLDTPVEAVFSLTPFVDGPAAGGASGTASRSRTEEDR
jgi:DNA-binding XRE family transcriptional regulator